MKINKFVEDLKAKSAAELNEELVAAKKELFNLRFQNAKSAGFLKIRRFLLQCDNFSHICILFLQRTPNNGIIYR